MTKLIRRFQQPLMILITIIVIIAFAWLYNDNRFSNQAGADRVGTLYGRPFTQTQILREARKYEVAHGLQLYGLIKALGNLPAQIPEEMLGMYRLPESVVEEYIWNAMVLKHEAQELGITATDKEVADGIMALPAFQTAGQYDSSKYKMFVANALPPLGLTPDVLEEIVGNKVRLEKIKTLLGTTSTPSAADIRETYEAMHRRLETAVVRFHFEDFAKAQTPTEEDVRKAYEERKATLMTEPLRKVKYVAFTLANVEKPLAGKERVDAMMPLADKAQEFAIAMTAKDANLAAVADKSGLKVEETPAFSENQPPSQLDQSPEIARAVFSLTKEQPNSDALQTDRGYYVVQLQDITPAREKSFDEAKVELADTLKNERGQEAMSLRATEVRNQIEAALKAGKSFADAATTAGVKAEALPTFSASEPPQSDPAGREVAQAARGLQEGQVSGFLPTNSGASQGGVLVYLSKKLPVDEEQFDKEKSHLATQVANVQDDAVFQQWFKARRAAANLQVVSRTKS